MKKSLKTLPNNWQERFENYFQSSDSKEILEKIEQILNLKSRKTCFRINTLKTSPEKVLEKLENNDIKVEKIPYLRYSYFLVNNNKRDLENLDIYKNWEIYLQNPSSQLPALILNPEPWEKVLDACSAPWSKTTQMASLMENSWEILAIELSHIRLEKLKYNLNKQWVDIVKTQKIDATNLLWILEKNSFDKILVDAPCSAEGRINLNNEKTYKFLSRKNTLEKARLQKNILKNVIPLLKSWWELVYSTCTLAPEENEAIVNFVLSQYRELEIMKIDLNLDFSTSPLKKWWKQIFDSRVENALKIIPSEQTEGFFIVKFRKK